MQSCELADAKSPFSTLWHLVNVLVSHSESFCNFFKQETDTPSISETTAKSAEVVANTPSHAQIAADLAATDKSKQEKTWKYWENYL